MHAVCMMFANGNYSFLVYSSLRFVGFFSLAFILFVHSLPLARMLVDCSNSFTQCAWIFMTQEPVIKNSRSIKKHRMNIKKITTITATKATTNAKALEQAVDVCKNYDVQSRSINWFKNHKTETLSKMKTSFAAISVPSLSLGWCSDSVCPLIASVGMIVCNRRDSMYLVAQYAQSMHWC